MTRQPGPHFAMRAAFYAFAIICGGIGLGLVMLAIVTSTGVLR